MALLDSTVDDVAHRTMGRFAEDQFTPPPRPPLAPPEPSPEPDLTSLQRTAFSANLPDFHARPIAHNPDGTISTVRSITVSDENGNNYVIPTVINGRVVSNDEAIRHWQQTGETMGVSPDANAADAYSQLIHEGLASDLAAHGGRAYNSVPSQIQPIRIGPPPIPFVSPTAVPNAQAGLAAAMRIRNAIQPTINRYGAIARTANLPTPLPNTNPLYAEAPASDPQSVIEQRVFGRTLSPTERVEMGLLIPQHDELAKNLSNPIGYAAGLATKGIEALPTGGGTSLGERIENLPGPLPTVGHLATGAIPFAALGPLGPLGEAIGLSQAAQGVATPLGETSAGLISGRQALTEAGLNAVTVLAPLVAIKGVEYLTSPEGRAVLDRLVPPEQRQAVLRKLSEERGGLIGGEKPPEVGAGEAAGLPAAADNLPSPPEAAVAKANPIDEASLAATEYIRKAEKLRPEQEQMFSEQRKQQLATAEQRFQQSGPNANIEARQATAGSFERPEFSPLELSPEHDAAIQHEINTSDQLAHAGERFQAHDAYDALKAGRLPQPAQLAALGKVLGPDFEQSVLDRAPRNWWNTALEVLSTSRALQATLDLSAALRQGIVGSVGHPQRFSQAFVSQIRALFSGDYAQQVHDTIINDPRYDLVRGKVDLTALPGEAKNQLTHREEAFQSQLAEKIPLIGPLIKASDRAFSTFTNKFRHDLAFDAIQRYTDSNHATPSEKWLTDLGHYVNNLTGRGSTKALGDYSAAVNAVFFSPKFLASRFQLIGDLMRPGQSAEIRTMAAKDIGSFVATGVGTLAAMKLAGINVEVDPRSTDFGKYVVGGQHHDFWAGYGPIARLIAQEATGERAKPSLTHGNVITDRDYAGALTGFLRNKYSPPASLAADWSQGTMGGKDVNLSSIYSGNPKTAFVTLDKDNPIIQRITPLFFQDAIQMYKQDGAKGLAGAPLAGLGESVTSYEPTKKQLSAQDKIAVQQKVEGTGFKQIQDRRKQASDARSAYLDKYGTTKEKRVAAEAFYDKQEKVKTYMKKINDDELAFWSKPANKALLKEAWEAGVDVQLGDTQVKKLLGIK